MDWLDGCDVLVARVTCRTWAAGVATVWVPDEALVTPTGWPAARAQKPPKTIAANTALARLSWRASRRGSEGAGTGAGTGTGWDRGRGTNPR